MCRYISRVRKGFEKISKNLQNIQIAEILIPSIKLIIESKNLND